MNHLYARCGITRTTSPSGRPSDDYRWWLLGEVKFTHTSLFGNAVLHIASTPLEELPILIHQIESESIELKYPATLNESYVPHGIDKRAMIGACLYRLEHEVAQNEPA